MTKTLPLRLNYKHFMKKVACCMKLENNISENDPLKYKINGLGVSWPDILNTPVYASTFLAEIKYISTSLTIKKN